MYKTFTSMYYSIVLVYTVARHGLIHASASDMYVHVYARWVGFQMTASRLPVSAGPGRALPSRARLSGRSSLSRTECQGRNSSMRLGSESAGQHRLGRTKPLSLVSER